MAEEAVLQPQEAPAAEPVVADEPMQQQEEQQQQQGEQEQQQQQQEQQPISTPVSTPSAASGTGVHQLQLYLQLVVQQHGIQPGICKRGERPPTVTGKVSDWSSVKKSKTTVTSTKKEGGTQQRERENPRSRWAQQRAGVHKIAGTAGRTFTSRFRGVHQTFPTKRWEAQFRRNGKPTSLGCFDQEDEAARAYDRMMLWCEIHGAAGSMKGSVTNFDLGEYEKDIAWLTSITQDDLIEALRSEGRKQAMNRQSGAVRRSHDTRGARSGGASDDAGGDATAEGADTTAGHNDDSMDVAGDVGAAGAAGAADGAAAAAAAAAEVEAAMAYAQADAAAAAAAAAAAGAMYDASAAGHLLQDAAAAAAAAAAAGRELMQDQVMQDADLAHHLAQQAHAGVGPLSVVLPGSAAAGAGAGANPLASPEAAAAAAAAAFLSPGALTSASPEALNLLFGSIGQDALAAVQQLQQQLDQAAASGAQPDADAAAAAAFQIGQIAGTNLLAALSANPSPAAGAAAVAAAGAGVPLPFGAAGGGDALAAYGLDDAAAAALAAVGGEDMTVGLQGGTGQQLQ